ncbi:motility protein A [Bdellovibrio sp.]|uniref:motility protein A n=1 Tax=Bdellovibrio sp. TaxID=28201 RepID=UPI0039E67A3F
MKSTWTGIFACMIVIYYGIVHSASNPWILLNPHAVILVVGGTLAIGLLTYPVSRLKGTLNFIIFGFMFRVKKEEEKMARDIISYIDYYYHKTDGFMADGRAHPFLAEAYNMVLNPRLSLQQMEAALQDRRNAIKRHYMDDAKILNNLAKYPPHLGLLGAASGMIEMMSALGKAGVDTIGGSMAVALSATLWGVGMNNFVFLPLADNSMKAAEDEIYLRDIIIECCLLMKSNRSHGEVLNTCLNRLSLVDRNKLAWEYRKIEDKRSNTDAA